MHIKIIRDDIVLHEIPLEKIKFDENKLIISVEDSNGKRFSIVFSPVQAFRATTADCIEFDAQIIDSCCKNTGIYKRHIIEILDSDWIEYLRKTLLLRNEHDFLHESRHFYIDIGDFVWEIVANNIKFYPE